VKIKGEVGRERRVVRMMTLGCTAVGQKNVWVHDAAIHSVLNHLGRVISFWEGDVRVAVFEFFVYSLSRKHVHGHGETSRSPFLPAENHDGCPLWQKASP
jgi:hypothetical protein